MRCDNGVEFADDYLKLVLMLSRFPFIQINLLKVGTTNYLSAVKFLFFIVIYYVHILLKLRFSYIWIGIYIGFRGQSKDLQNYRFKNDHKIECTHWLEPRNWYSLPHRKMSRYGKAIWTSWLIYFYLKLLAKFQANIYSY